MTNLAGALVAIRVPLGGRLQAPGASLSQQQQLTYTQQLSNTGLIFVSWVAAHFVCIARLAGGARKRGTS